MPLAWFAVCRCSGRRSWLGPAPANVVHCGNWSCGLIALSNGRSLAHRHLSSISCSPKPSGHPFSHHCRPSMMERLSPTAQFLSSDEHNRAPQICKNLQIRQLSSRASARCGIPVKVGNDFAAIKITINPLEHHGHSLFWSSIRYWVCSKEYRVVNLRKIRSRIRRIFRAFYLQVSVIVA